MVLLPILLACIIPAWKKPVPPLFSFVLRSKSSGVIKLAVTRGETLELAANKTDGKSSVVETENLICINYRRFIFFPGNCIS